MALKWTSNFVRYSYMCNNVYLHVFVWFCMHIFIYFCGIYNLWVFFFTDFLPCHEVLTGSNMLFPPVTGHVFSASRWGSQAAMDVATMWGRQVGKSKFCHLLWWLATKTWMMARDARYSLSDLSRHSDAVRWCEMCLYLHRIMSMHMIDRTARVKGLHASEFGDDPCLDALELVSS